VANATAQLAYSALSPNGRWNFPSFYYTLNATFPDAATGASVSIEWVFIDTVILCGLSVAGEKGQPVPPADATPASVQLAWITETLAASKADWLIVAGHYPVYSVAEHGSTTCLVEQLRPLLIENKAAMYINGHDRSCARRPVQGRRGGACVSD
jgi:tartrate-resistant acid phosphatase type 5